MNLGATRFRLRWPSDIWPFLQKTGSTPEPPSSLSPRTVSHEPALQLRPQHSSLCVLRGAEQIPWEGCTPAESHVPPRVAHHTVVIADTSVIIIKIRCLVACHVKEH